MTGNLKIKQRALLLLGCVLLLTAGCGNDEPTNAVKKVSVDDKTGAPSNLRIVFKWPGDDFASMQDMAIMDKIVNRIRDRGVGTVIRTGTGMGWMDILIQVENKDSAIPKLNAIINDTGTGLNVTIENMERSP